MDQAIGHVAFGGTELYELRAAANEVGLTPTYGGEHGTGMTHVAIVPFPDGLYLGLIASTLGTNVTGAGFWSDYLAVDVGPAAWCLGTDDAVGIRIAIDAGPPADGPHEAPHARPDGHLIEWDTYFEGSDQRFPFFIHDHTPRGYHIPEAAPNASLRGLQIVVVATRDREAIAVLFARWHQYPSPADINGPFPKLATLPGTPLTLYKPDNGALDAHIDEVGEGSRASLVGVTDPDRTRTALSLSPEIWYSDRYMAWFGHDLFDGWLGAVELS